VSQRDLCHTRVCFVFVRLIPRIACAGTGNSILDAGATAIAECMKKNASVRTSIYLNGDKAVPYHNSCAMVVTTHHHNLSNCYTVLLQETKSVMTVPPQSPRR
jgi:hypothetical protein